MKEEQIVLLTCLKAREKRVKEVEERDVTVQEDNEENLKEIIEIQQSKYIETLDKAKGIDTNVSNQACTGCRFRSLFIFH